MRISKYSIYYSSILKSIQIDVIEGNNQWFCPAGNTIIEQIKNIRKHALRSSKKNNTGR